MLYTNALFQQQVHAPSVELAYLRYNFYLHVKRAQTSGTSGGYILEIMYSQPALK